MAGIDGSNSTVNSTQAPKLSNQSKIHGGYDTTFVKKPENLQTDCSVCLCLLRDPHLVECCGNRFCRTCIEQVKLKNKMCPLCNETLKTVAADKQLQRQLNGHDVYCTHKCDGCDWTGELRELELHINAYNLSDENRLKGCCFTLLKCTYCKCDTQRRDLREHEFKKCDLRPFSCDYCNDYSSTFVDVTEKHWPLCDYRSVTCPNFCGIYPERRNLKDHVENVCPLTEVSCDFNYAGCAIKLTREVMPKHLVENMVTHMSMLAVTCKQQQITYAEQLAELRKEFKLKIATLEEKLVTAESLLLRYEPPFVLQMDSTSKHTSTEDQWISSPFYSHFNGYKFCIGAMISRQQNSEITVVFFQIYIMRGEFDEYLKWPLNAEVQVKVFINDEELEGYVECDRKIKIRSAERVVNGQRSDSGYCPNVHNPSFDSNKCDKVSFQICEVKIL